MNGTKPRLRTLFLSVLLLSVIIGLWLVRWHIYDWLQLRNYTPAPAITKIADQTTMNDDARHYFFLNHPDIQPNPAFSSSCPNNGGEQTIVLGCYHAHETGIFLYNVTDTKLDGVVQVTAAHEVLHAIYDRLSTQQKKYVNGLLEDYYQHDLHDQRLRDTVAAYQKLEPNDVVNEMHSIFGTEIVSLPPALETYYSRYFTNRKQIAQYAQQYQNAFVSRRDQVNADDVKLKSTKQQIDDLETELENQSQILTAERKHMDGLLASNRIADYNDEVPVYNQKVTAYNQTVNRTRQLIDQYNALVKERNSLALEENELIKAIDSRPSTVTTQ